MSPFLGKEDRGLDRGLDVLPSLLEKKIFYSSLAEENEVFNLVLKEKRISGDIDCTHSGPGRIPVFFFSYQPILLKRADFQEGKR